MEQFCWTFRQNLKYHIWGEKITYEETQTEQKHAIWYSCWYLYGQKVRWNSDCNVNQWDLYNSIEGYLHKMQTNNISLSISGEGVA